MFLSDGTVCTGFENCLVRILLHLQQPRLYGQLAKSQTPEDFGGIGPVLSKEASSWHLEECSIVQQVGVTECDRKRHVHQFYTAGKCPFTMAL